MEFHPSYYSADYENAIANVDRNTLPPSTINVPNYITHGLPDQFSGKDAILDNTRPVNCEERHEGFSYRSSNFIFYCILTIIFLIVAFYF